MNTREFIEYVSSLSNQEKRDIPYDKLVYYVKMMDSDEIIELSNIIGYPVFARLCMGELNHRFVFLQDGASAIIFNDKGQILLQQRSDNDRWGLPGGVQDLGERFEETIIREVKEETNLDVKEEDLELIGIVSGMNRMRQYPNGDVVVNNSVLYLIKNYTGDLEWDEESKIIKFFDIDNLPENQHDNDLVEIYKQYKIVKKQS